MELIKSLNSPHVKRVKALLGSRGKKNRTSESAFVVEGFQAVRESLTPKLGAGLEVIRLYLTEAGMNKLTSSLGISYLEKYEVLLVSDQVMSAMTEVESSQGIIAICSTKTIKLDDIWQRKPNKLALFWQIQDPGNAGTVIRSADAAGFDAVIFTTESVDIFNPKTVRATVGSLWHIPVVGDVDINEFIVGAVENGISLFALASEAKETFNSDFVAKASSKPSAWIFGNEARGLPELPHGIVEVAIPMKGFAESLNVASAAAIVLHSVGQSL
jgi:TrmH family RNA methyltransferase